MEHPRFQARAFDPRLGHEAVEGEIEVDSRRLCFHAEAVELEIPLPRLTFAVAPGAEERLCFGDRDEPGCKIFTTDVAVLDQPALARLENIESQWRALRTRRAVVQRLTLTAWVLGACVLLGWLATVASGVMIRSLLARVPPTWERELGDSLITELEAEVHFVADTNRVARLAALAAPLLSGLPDKGAELHFHLVEVDEPNAMALPGGHVIVTTGLLHIAGRPEEVLGAIAHELAHETQKHGLRKIVTGAGPVLVVRLFLGNNRGLLAMLTQGSGTLVRQSFSQAYETEADDVGWRYLVAAHVDPSGLADLLRKLKAREDKHLMRLAAPQAFSSHPAVDKRIARLEARWQRLPRKSGFVELTWEGLRTP